jgi:hypothetical protein
MTSAHRRVAFRKSRLRFGAWVRGWFAPARRAKGTRQAAALRQRRALFEALEGRQLLAPLFVSNGSLGTLNIPSATTVNVDSNAMTLSWRQGSQGLTFYGRPVSESGENLAQFDFTNISIASGVTFNVTGSQPVASVRPEKGD